MIKIEYTITFTEDNGLDLIAPLPSNIATVLALSKEAATARGCVPTVYNNDARSQRVLTFVWDSQTAIDSFNDFANQNYQYSAIYQEFVALVESKGGTIERVVSEI